MRSDKNKQQPWGWEVASSSFLGYAAPKDAEFLQSFYSQDFGVGGHTFGGVLGFINPN